MAVARAKTRREQYAEVDAYCERLRLAMREAIKEGKQVEATEEAGTHDVPVGGPPFKALASNGTYLFTIDIGPYWSDYA